MQKFGRFVFAAFLCVASAHAQEKGTSNLVFVLDKSLSRNKFTFQDAKDYPVDVKVWYKEDVDFYRNFIVEPKEYRVFFPGPVRSVTINTTPGQSTYIRISPYRLDDEIAGVQITSWTGLPGKAVAATVEYLEKQGFKEDILPTKLGLTGNVIRLVPDAPWPIPPPPPPK